MLLVGALAIAVPASAGGGSADAAPPPPGDVNPLECLNQWDNNPNYVGEGWVGARVRVVRDVLEREVFLGCGDELSGVIHIAHPDTTGTLHPIPPGEEASFLRCFERTIQTSAISPAGEGRRKYEFDWLKDNPGNSEVPQQVMRSTAFVAENSVPTSCTRFSRQWMGACPTLRIPTEPTIGLSARSAPLCRQPVPVVLASPVGARTSGEPQRSRASRVGPWAGNRTVGRITSGGSGHACHRAAAL